MRSVKESLVLSFLVGVMVLTLSGFVGDGRFGRGFSFGLAWSGLNILVIRGLTDSNVLLRKTGKLRLIALLALKLPLLYGVAVAGLALRWVSPGQFALGFSTPVAILLVVVLLRARREALSSGQGWSLLARKENWR